VKYKLWREKKIRVKIPRAAPCVCKKLRLACSTSGLKLKKFTGGVG
jgi:hypothetical protein